MAELQWHPSVLREVFVLPAQVADDCLKTASVEELRVLLWFSRHQQAWDAAACATAVGLSAQDCEDCLYSWMERGVLTPVGEVATALAPVAAAKAAPAPRPAPVKPRVQEVLAYQKEHPDFAVFLEAASARLGKPLSHGDTATLLYLLDTVGLSGDVILLEIAYAVSLGKGNMRYVEKLALNWADEELTTLPVVDAHIAYLERCRTVGDRVEQMVLPPRPFTAAQRELAVKWVEDWHFSDDLLRLAAAIARENVTKSGNFTAYMDGILRRWLAEGIDSPDEVQVNKPTGKKKGPAATNPEESSLDTDEFEQALLRYRPRFGENT